MANDLISRQAAIGIIKRTDVEGISLNDVIAVTEIIARAVEKLPSAEPEIVRCKDCRYYKIDHPNTNGYHCCYRNHNIFPMQEDDFCSRAERRTDETD